MNTYFIPTGGMHHRIGEGTWGCLYDGQLLALQEHKRQIMYRPQKLEFYGDKDIRHDKLIVRDEWAESDLPEDAQLTFELTDTNYWYAGTQGRRYWCGDGKFFVFFAVTIAGKTSAEAEIGERGYYYPDGCVRDILEAYRFVEDERGLVFQFLSWSFIEEAYQPITIDGPNGPRIAHTIVDLSWIKNPDSAVYTVRDESVVYDAATGTFRWDVIPVEKAKRIPVIPYYWQDWMWQMHPEIPVTDYEAYSECYRNAVANVTQSGMNNIANIMEVADVVHDIKKGNITGLFESLKQFCDKKNISNAVKVGQDGWLKYRYLYGTTKADAEAAVDYFLDEKWKSLTDRQVVRGRIGLSDGELRLKMRLRESADLSLQLRTDLKSVGLFPDLYTLWDLVPYSFVVDWFVPSFSEELEDLSQAYLSAAYDVKELLVTRKRSWDIQYAGFDYHAYSYERVFDEEPPQFEFYEETSTPKGKTVVKRIIDGFALFIK
jgi:hypothetical protein